MGVEFKYHNNLWAKTRKNLTQRNLCINLRYPSVPQCTHPKRLMWPSYLIVLPITHPIIPTIPIMRMDINTHMHIPNLKWSSAVSNHLQITNELNDLNWNIWLNFLQNVVLLWLNSISSANLELFLCNILHIIQIFKTLVLGYKLLPQRFVTFAENRKESLSTTIFC